jgi:DNA polymerase-3 subunit chi
VSDKESFLAHAMAGTDHARAGMSCTLIWLGSGAVAGSPPVLLLNIGAAMPDDWACCERIVELVSRDEEDAQAGRQRWARYGQLGLQPVHRQVTPEGPEDA